MAIAITIATNAWIITHPFEAALLITGAILITIGIGRLLTLPSRAYETPGEYSRLDMMDTPTAATRADEDEDVAA